MPDWYRPDGGREKGKLAIQKWRTDPEDPRYAKAFGDLIRAFGKRYDGHPDLESVDLSIVERGRGRRVGGTHSPTREALVDAYLESFQRRLWSCC